MKQVRSLMKEQILSIPLDKPELLFSGDLTEAKMQFRILTKKWFPKGDGSDPTVMAHINPLYEEAVRRIERGIFGSNSILEIFPKDGSHRRLRYLSSREFELGRMYVGRNCIGYAINNKYASLVEDMPYVLGKFDASLRLRNIEDEHKKHLPDIVGIFPCKDFTFVLIKKKEEWLPLRNVLEHFKGKMDAKHVAWIISSMLNINCFLEMLGIVHNAISVDNVIINAKDHDTALIGGWWYSAVENSRIRFVPNLTLSYGPCDLPINKKAVRDNDNEMIKALGRELLGDISGSRLIMDDTVPKPITDWLRSPATDETAYSMYSVWYSKILIEAFKERRFVELNIDELHA